MKLRKLFIVVCCILLWANFVHAQVNRPYEPIVLTGDTLSQFLNQEIKYLYLYAYDLNADSWQMIPFQIDEVNPYDQDSIYFKPDSSVGLLDADDELVFLLNDLGDQADSTSWLAGADSVRYEISFYDSLDDQRGYAYLYFSRSIKEPAPNRYAMAYDALNDRVMSLNYEVGFNNTGQLGDVVIKSGSGIDIFDRLKIRAFGWLWVAFVYLDETALEMEYAYAKVGPVRVIRNMYGRFYWQQLNIEETFTQTSFFYPWNGKFELYKIPIGGAVNIGAKVDLIRVSWDFNQNTKGMRFFSENNRNGVVIDTTYDDIDPSCSPDELNWTMGTGDQGTLLNVFYVPPLGDKIHIYYYDANDGKTGDPGLQFDTGDGLSFADNGFSLEENIEQYAEAESTLNVIYYNYFLPPNFNPNEGSTICNQLNSPLAYNTKVDTLHRPTKVAQKDYFLPDEFLLEQNHPNPFNSSTMISFYLPKSTQISLHIFDSLGRLIYTFVDQRLPQGSYNFVWNGINNEGMPMPSGLYFYKLKTLEFNSVRKLLLIK